MEVEAHEQAHKIIQPILDSILKFLGNGSLAKYAYFANRGRKSLGYYIWNVIISEIMAHTLDWLIGIGILLKRLLPQINQSNIKHREVKTSHKIISDIALEKNKLLALGLSKLDSRFNQSLDNNIPASLARWQNRLISNCLFLVRPLQLTVTYLQTKSFSNSLIGVNFIIRILNIVLLKINLEKYLLANMKNYSKQGLQSVLENKHSRLRRAMRSKISSQDKVIRELVHLLRQDTNNLVLLEDAVKVILLLAPLSKGDKLGLKGQKIFLPRISGIGYLIEYLYNTFPETRSQLSQKQRLPNRFWRGLKQSA